jgi:twitching motility protein PilT
MFPSYQQNQVRAQFSSVLLAVISQRLLMGVQKDKRVLACEVLRNTTAVAAMIREGKTEQIMGAMETQAKLGMATLDSSIKALYLAGKIPESEAKKHMRYPQSLFGV